jgi:hypothetical protein
VNQKRGQWHLLTGLILGIVVGVVLSVYILPVRYIDTEPQTLRFYDRERYRSLVALAYVVEADTTRALARISLLKDSNSATALISQAQNMLASNGDELTARGLALLGAAVNQPSLHITAIPTAVVTQRPTATAFTATPEVTAVTPTTQSTQATTAEPTTTRTPAATFTARPTSTQQPTLGALFVLVEQKSVCEPLPAIPLIEIEVRDAGGNPLPGVKIQLSQLNGGTETFYTGLYQEISAGYANYVMSTGMEYALRVGEAGQLISGLTIPVCETESPGSAPGSLYLLFQQP